ncbi:MAG: carboxypeptidase regulatory-like domain-containing protein, partial [Thermoplasmata archaeon]|nr:carboxypeptidase regulatory-like domain-containing protein [Thermoplasmata archaeon]
GGFITGGITDGLTGLPVPNGLSPLADVSPAGTGTGGGIGAALNGKFNISSPAGWFSVTAVASDYEPNVTWVHVNDSTVPTSAGTIPLVPVSWLSGQVLDENGTPLEYATVTTCEIGSDGCRPVLEGGGSNTFGEYIQTLSAGPLPLGTYEVTASAPGYVTNSTWVNVSVPGQDYTAPPINLTPFLEVHAHSLTSGSLLGASDSLPDPFEYLVGELLDNNSGEGIPTATLTLNSVHGGSTVLQGSITDGGEFNYTVATGSYWTNITAPQYYPSTIFLNVSGLVPQLSLGMIRLVPFVGFVRGQIDIGPASWQWLTTVDGLGPSQVQVTVCDQTIPPVCNTGEADASGFFNVTAPFGYHDTIDLQPSGNVPTGVGSAPYGFVSGVSNANVLNGSNSAFVRTSLDIFGGFTGSAFDESTQNQTPIRFGTISVIASNGTYGQVDAEEQLGGGGAFTVFLPPGKMAAVVGGSAFVPLNFTSPKDVGDITPGAITVLTPMSLRHFGWITGNLTARDMPYEQGNRWIEGAGVSTSFDDPVLGATIGGQASSDGIGYFNVTAPPFPTVVLEATAPDFNTTFAFDIDVNQSETVTLADSRIPAMVPWGWVVGTVTDPIRAAPVDAAGVLVTDPVGIYRSNTGIVTSEDGRFMADSIPGHTDQMIVQHYAYLPNTSTVNVSAGNVSSLRSVSLTGLGVVAGQILGLPSGALLGGAVVDVCPVTSPSCTNFATVANQQGVFWASAPPGTDIVSASFPQYASNASVIVQVASDSWVWVGTIQLYAFATTSGMILGIPSGLPLSGADVSYCSTVLVPGEPTGPCFTTVQTNGNGQFTITAPGGTYLLALSAYGYASAYILLSVLPGELADFGTLLLQQDGIIIGNVIGADTDAPVPGTTVFACATNNANACTGSVGLNATGNFLLEAMPGPYLLIATAPGYQDSYEAVTAVSGTVANADPIELVPVGSSQFFEVSGTILGSVSSTPIVGATVISAGGYASAPTAGDGAYTVLVPWGEYDFVARAAGYDPSSLTEIVHENLTGVDFSLYPSAFSVTGTVRDGLTGGVLEGAELKLTLTGGELATTDANGEFTALLSNGTYSVTVELGGGAVYEPLSFVLTINGANLQRNVSLFPPWTNLYGLIVSARSGLPVANATVIITGVTSTGLPWSTTLQTSALGTLGIVVYSGSYVVQANATGFVGATQQFAPVGSSQQITLLLTPTLNEAPTTANPTPSTGTAVLWYGSLAAVAAVTLLGVFWVTRGARQRGETV